MTKEDIIREACSLDDAKGKFAVRMYNNGYMIEGDPIAYWQENLFGSPDVIVRCKVRKKVTRIK